MEEVIYFIFGKPYYTTADVILRYNLNLCNVFYNDLYETQQL